LRRSAEENAILFNIPINSEVSADLSASVRYRDINVAAISTKNLSALVGWVAVLIYLFGAAGCAYFVMVQKRLAAI
jgi:hypothetical protein